jgi:hypothetical protein
MSDTITTTNATPGMPTAPRPPLWRRPWAQAAAGLTLLAAVGVMAASATNHPDAVAPRTAPASLPFPQATSATQVVNGDDYAVYKAVSRANLAGPNELLYASGHIDNAATGVHPGPGGWAELIVIARTPADAAMLAAEMRSTVDAIDAANPVPSPYRLALTYLPNDPDKATAGPLIVRVIGNLDAMQAFLGTWSPNPAALLPPTGASPAAAAPRPASPAPASPLPAANTSGCPSSAQLMAAWDAASAEARRSWTPLVPSGMSDITCWRTWAVASPIVNANGLVVFYEQGRQWHLLPQTQLSQFDTAVCDIPGAPAEWSSPAEGPATCS